MEETGLPDASFDAVILSQSLHHAAKPKEALAESHRLLAPLESFSKFPKAAAWRLKARARLLAMG